MCAYGLFRIYLGLVYPETRKPRNPETMKPRNHETQKPTNPETRKPRNQETQKPRSPEAQKPGNPETQKPSHPSNPSNPRSRAEAALSRWKLTNAALKNNQTRRRLARERERCLLSSLEYNSREISEMISLRF